MATPFLGEIRMFAGTFAPQGWAFCDGQLLGVSQNDALFALLGTTYGGDGRQTFGLPDLRGRVPVDAGAGVGLPDRRLGEKGGAEQVELTGPQLPVHEHQMMATGETANQADPNGSVLAASSETNIYSSGSPGGDANSSAIGETGGSQAHSNMGPFLCVHFIVALAGRFPSRN